MAPCSKRIVTNANFAIAPPASGSRYQAISLTPASVSLSPHPPGLPLSGRPALSQLTPLPTDPLSAPPASLSPPPPPIPPPPSVLRESEGKGREVGGRRCGGGGGRWGGGGVRVRVWACLRVHMRARA